MNINQIIREQRQVILVAVLGLFVLVLYLGYGVGPLIGKMFELGGKVRDSQKEVRLFEAVVANEGRLRIEQEELEKRVVLLRGSLPNEERLSFIIEKLSNLASQTQVKVQTIFPKRSFGNKERLGSGTRGYIESEEGPVYKMVQIEIDAVAGYHELGTFLSLVEADPNPMILANMRISADPKKSRRHVVKLIINVFFATDQSDQPA